MKFHAAGALFFIGLFSSQVFAESSLAQEIVAQHGKNGGSTFLLKDRANQVGRSFFAVSPYEEREVRVRRLTPQAVDRFIEVNRSLLMRPGHAIGTWYDPDSQNAVIDVVRLEHRDEAIESALVHGQASIYDLSRREEIALDPPFLCSEFGRRVR